MFTKLIVTKPLFAKYFDFFYYGLLGGDLASPDSSKQAQRLLN